jgi:repressor LexA
MKPQVWEVLPVTRAERKPLTEQQRKILDFIKQAQRERGYPPSVREIGDGVGLNSSSTVHGHLSRLEEKGYIRRDSAKPRALEIIDEEGARSPGRVLHVPVIGQVAAGQPILAEQHMEESLPVAPGFVQADPNDLFFLTVKGESMVDAGILSGDYILVKRQATAVNGEIVVAVVEGEATVKRFYKERDRIRLQPENRYMDPIFVQNCDIAGKVVGVIRRV